MKTLKYAARFLMRAKSYTVINLLGLAFSLACCIILMRYIHRELTVDTHCVDRERSVVAIRDINNSRFVSSIDDVHALMKKEMIRKDDIIKRCSFIDRRKDNLIYKEQSYNTNVWIADSTFFHFFNYPLVEGECRLNAPDDAILTIDAYRVALAASGWVPRIKSMGGSDTDYLSLAKKLDLTKGILSDSYAPLMVADANTLIWNMLRCERPSILPSHSVF